MAEYDVIVVGGGNAAFCAALAAQEQGAKVVVLEAAPEDEAGGNSRFTAGSIRVVYNGVDDIRTLIPDLTDKEVEETDFGTYTAEKFFDDMALVTQNRANPDLVELLVTKSFDTLNWMREKGVRFIPIYGRQAFKIDGKFKFWGGLTVEAVGGGPGLVNMLTESAKKRGIEVRYQTRALSLIHTGDRVEGVRVRHDGRDSEIRGKSVILATGGFQANPEWRTRYLGPGWDLAKVRGTRFNTGDGIRMALEIGASPCGNWSGCHAVQWEMNAPEFGDLAVGDQFQKHSYPFAMLVNATGKRFVDEGADFRNYTYAKYGRVVLEQPGQFAWQSVRPEGQAPAARRIPHPPDHQGDRQHHRGIRVETRRRQRRAIHQDRRRMEQGGAHRRPVQSEREGRPLHGRACDQQVELGEHARYAALRRLCRDLRHHLHLRRLAREHRLRGPQHRLPADPRALRRGRTGRRHLLLQLSRRLGALLRLGVRQDRRHLGRPRQGELI